MPVTYSRENGIYRSFRWGKHLEVFLLDERSFRSAKASANHACDNPNTGEPDQAPTASGTIARAQFGLVVSGTRGPVTQGCKDTLRDPRRTFLGARQLARFKREVRSSDATWKAILSETPIQAYYALPYDRWEGYVHERQELLRYLRDNVKNVVFLSTDVHANLVNDVWIRGFEEGGSIERSGILEVTTGPVATMSYNKEINATVGSDAVGPGVNTLVFKAPPPQGVGMQCAQIDQFSYGQVSVTGPRLTIALKQLDGSPVTDFPSGNPCGPYTLDKE
jgi:phosphodiesterase/alkaline phosphatase D-like protein